MPRGLRTSVSVRWLVGIVVVLAVLVAIAGRMEARPEATRRLAVASAVERTLAARSARFVATYQRAHGPPVRLWGVTSFVGPQSEVLTAAGDDPPLAVRVSSTGVAWLRAPGAEAWVPVPAGSIASLGTTGWADVVRSVDASRDDVQLDGAGRIVEVRRRAAGGDVLEVRFRDFGVEVDVPP